MTLSVELAGIVGDAGIETDPASIGARLRDNSWLSPVLSGHIDAMAGASAAARSGWRPSSGRAISTSSRLA